MPTRTPRPIRPLALLLTALHALAPGHAADGGLDAHDGRARTPAAHAITLDRGQLSGPGLDWIEQRAADSHFVLLGEQHGVEEVGAFAGGLYRALFDDGYTRVALEIGPFIGDRLSQEPVAQAIATYPFSIAFANDSELDFLESVGDRFEGEGPRIWGLDQELTAVHPLLYLMQRTQDPNAAGLLKRELAQAVQLEGDYLDEDRGAAWDALSEALGATPGDGAYEIIDALRTSNEIYATYHAQQRGEVSGDPSGRQREQYMQHRFDELLGVVSNQTGQTPRVLMKLGGLHVMKQPNPNGYDTLGMHVERVAARADTDALHLGISGIDRADLDDRLGRTLADEVRRAAPEPGTALVLLDFQAARANDPELPETMRTDLERFDARVLVLDPSPGVRDRIDAARARVRAQAAQLLGG
ncbi:MAG: hypothetical protein ACF8Q5_02495 [Phycisphaerales bacterium JB040]